MDVFANVELMPNNQRNNRDLLGRGTGYQWLWGRRCPVSESAFTANTAMSQLADLCASDGGQLDGKGLCRDESDSEVVLYAANFGAASKCGNVEGLGFEIITPTPGQHTSNYIRRLREYGYRGKPDERPSMEMLLGQVERNSQLGNVVLQSRPGTKICKETVIRYLLNEAPIVIREEEGTVVAELLSVDSAELEVQFKVIELRIPNQSINEIPLSTAYRADELNVNPGDTGWDSAWSPWQVCE